MKTPTISGDSIASESQHPVNQKEKVIMNKHEVKKHVIAVGILCLAVASPNAEAQGYGYSGTTEQIEARIARGMVQRLRESAERGDSTSQSMLGRHYERGDGVARNMDEAIKWYRKAANQGHIGAQLDLRRLGIDVPLGRNVPKEDAEGSRQQRALNNARNNIGEEDWTSLEALINDESLSERGRPVRVQQTNAAEKEFQRGWSFFQQEKYSEAVKWYRKAAEQGHALAQYNLGVCYVHGNGVREDVAEAFKWIKKSAEQGFKEAQYCLGVCYANGDGVREDAAEAAKWYRRAAEQGDVRARKALEALMGKNAAESVTGYRNSTESPQYQTWTHDSTNDTQSMIEEAYKKGAAFHDQGNVTEAAKWYRKAAEQGHAEAQLWLGNCYYLGEGVPKDEAEAERWWRKAAEQGQADAQKALARQVRNRRTSSLRTNNGSPQTQNMNGKSTGDGTFEYNMGALAFQRSDYSDALQWFRKAAAKGNGAAQSMIGSCERLMR